MKSKVLPETEVQAMKVAKGTQKSGQTKEQTKLIAQGIEKGIAEYKKQHSKKLREIDKQRKQTTKLREKDITKVEEEAPNTHTTNQLPWILLVLSWVGFAAYITLSSVF